MKKRVTLGIDLGTTSNRVFAFSDKAEIYASASREFKQYYPKPAWVEHDPIEIWQTTYSALKEVSEKCGVENIRCIGIANQRETTVLWDSQTGTPVYNAIVWQCRRTHEICNHYQKDNKQIQKKTGLICDPYFSATKIQWILQNIPAAKESLKNRTLNFGTIDSWILWNLTHGQAHKTDHSNASRTLLMNLHTLSYDPELLELFKIPEEILPQIQNSSSYFGETSERILGKSIPITGILGDQQAALFAQGGWEKGCIKNTYGTGLFMNMCTGKTPVHIPDLLTTVAWTDKNNAEYAVEGSAFIAGASIQWLRDGLKILKSVEESEKIAGSLTSNEGVYFVPALAGLGAPYWDPEARGMYIGLTRQTHSGHLVRAALESIAYQTRDILDNINKHLKNAEALTVLKVDGGACTNNFLLQFQADVLNMSIERPTTIESSALGAASIAGMTTEQWTRKSILKYRKIDTQFKPKESQTKTNDYYKTWQEAVSRSRQFAKFTSR